MQKCPCIDENTSKGYNCNRIGKGEITRNEEEYNYLVKYYAEKNDAGFRNEVYEIAREFDKSGDYQLAEYVMYLISNTNTFVPQMSEKESVLRRIETEKMFE